MRPPAMCRRTEWLWFVLEGASSELVGFQVPCPLCFTVSALLLLPCNLGLLGVHPPPSCPSRAASSAVLLCRGSETEISTLFQGLTTSMTSTRADQQASTPQHRASGERRHCSARSTASQVAQSRGVGLGAVVLHRLSTLLPHTLLRSVIEPCLPAPAAPGRSPTKLDRASDPGILSACTIRLLQTK